MEIKYPNAVVTKDENYGQVYVCIKPELSGVCGCVVKTIEIKDNVYLDLDEKGEVVGIEIL